MTIHPRGLIYAAACGLVLWLAADLRLAAAVAIATVGFDWLQLTNLAGARRR